MQSPDLKQKRWVSNALIYSGIMAASGTLYIVLELLAYLPLFRETVGFVPVPWDVSWPVCLHLILDYVHLFPGSEWTVRMFRVYFLLNSVIMGPIFLLLLTKRKHATRMTRTTNAVLLGGLVLLLGVDIYSMFLLNLVAFGGVVAHTVTTYCLVQLLRKGAGLSHSASVPFA